MKQLFVCHTQYNLILAAGLSSSDDELILFKDFNLTEELERKLEGHFKRCLFLEGNYPKKELPAGGEADQVYYNIIKALIEIYDSIIIFEIYAFKKLHN